MPSKNIFSSTKFSSSILQKRMRELAFLNKELIYRYTIIPALKKEFINKFDGGILEFVKYINQKKTNFS